MEAIHEKLDTLIEKLEDKLLKLDPNSKEFRSTASDLNKLLERRNQIYVSEMEAIDKMERIDIDRNKADRELHIKEATTKIDRLKAYWEPFKTILPVGVTAALAITGMKIETEDHVILSHDVKKWIPSIKIPFK